MLYFSSLPGYFFETEDDMPFQMILVHHRAALVQTQLVLMETWTYPWFNVLHSFTINRTKLVLTLLMLETEYSGLFGQYRAC